MKTGYTIRRLREKYEITLQELSTRTGVQIATLSRIEHFKMTGTMQAYMALAEAFEMKLSKFFVECEKDLDAGYPERKKPVLRLKPIEGRKVLKPFNI